MSQLLTFNISSSHASARVPTEIMMTLLFRFTQLKQKGNHVSVDQGTTSASEEDIAADILGQHDQFVSSMQSRFAKLQVTQRKYKIMLMLLVM